MDVDPHNDAWGDREESTSVYRSIIEAIQDGVFIVDLDGTITYVNDSLCSLTGRERNELVGNTFDTLVESAEFDRFVTTINSIADGEIQDEILTFEIDQETEQMVDVRVSKHIRDDGTDDIVGVVRDVTDRERRARAAEQKQEVLAKLYQVGAEDALTFEQKAERILSIGCEYLDLPFGFLSRIEEDTQEIVHAVGDHTLLQPDETAPLEQSYCRKTIESDDLVGMQDAQAELGDDDPAYELFDLGCYIGTKVMVGETLYGTFCFAAPHDRDREFNAGEREVIKLLGQWAGYELERQRFEERLEGLHEISQQLLAAETTTDVANITIEMIVELFNLPVSAFWKYDANQDVLRPVTETDEAIRIVGEAPTFERGDALLWKSFDSGEIRNYEDLPEQPGANNPETPLRSEVHVPCGTHGIITSSATEPRAFDEIDIESLRLLEALVTEAITAVKREEQLAERGEALQRQNDRLEEFADVVAHELRNPMTGAVGFLEIARKTNESQHFERVEQSLERMEELIDELLMIARGDRQAVNIRTLSLQPIVEEAWSYTDAPKATLSADDPLGEIQADDTRLLQLFGNLFRNSVEHGGDDVTVEVGPLADEEGFYVADDGPGFSDKQRTEIEALGDTDEMSGIGIGLMNVVDVVEAHGWDLSVPATDQGARIEIRTGERSE
ncbi:GAF domain-containing protein [Haloarcula marismortui]|uniref:histidine kinase n=1 Tax=Haloarcula marismortui ATCC 33799 TaxID=662475 RepID=M0K1Y0_9EURY|nr:GAF domain-containing protein [Haloarcula californiae]EMA14124.1 light and oxygen sensing histidine kinase [Haloarcula californiae ATCC 33799]